MRRLMVVFAVITILSLALTSVAFAEHTEPLGGCPDGFHLHHIMDHDEEHEHEHVHIGVDVDSNNDTYICVKHLFNTYHLHIDNFSQVP